jgi:hypothetical protein
MENENDSDLGKLLFECKKGFRYYGGVFGGVAILLLCYLNISSEITKFTANSNSSTTLLGSLIIYVLIFLYWAFYATMKLYQNTKRQLKVFENALIVSDNEIIYISDIKVCTFLNTENKNYRTILLKLNNSLERGISTEALEGESTAVEIIQKQIEFHKQRTT